MSDPIIRGKAHIYPCSDVACLQIACINANRIPIALSELEIVKIRDIENAIDVVKTLNDENATLRASLSAAKKELEDELALNDRWHKGHWEADMLAVKEYKDHAANAIAERDAALKEREKSVEDAGHYEMDLFAARAEIEKLAALIVEIRDKWVPALRRDAREADKVHCNALSIESLIVRLCPEHSHPAVDLLREKRND